MSEERVYHINEVTNLKDLSISKRIRCHYTASSGMIGVFSGMGEETSEFIPPISSETPNGDFYLIHVGNDRLGRKILMADRNIQHTISWDTLNSTGLANGSGAPIYFDEALGKSVFGSSLDAPYSIVNAVDGNYSTLWYSTGTGGNIENDRIIIDLNEPMDINKVSLVSTAISCKDFIVQYSDDNINFFNAYQGTHINIDKLRHTYTFSNVGKHRYWAIYILSTWTTGSSSGLYSVSLHKRTDFSIDIRLPSGGVSSNTANEWNDYIVNSTLNGTISAGDNDVWNWSGIGSWTSTSPSTPANRVVRGNSALTTHTIGQVASAFNSTIGFRPIFIVEFLPQSRSFLRVANEYLTYRGDSWSTVSTILPSVENFRAEGIEDISILNRKETIIEYLMNEYDVGEEVLGDGKIFKGTIDLNNFIDIISLRIK